MDGWLNPVRHILCSSLIFRGSKDENAVLCTHNQTYDVKEAETSNSLLLLPDLRWPAQIADQTGRMLEEKQVIDFHYRKMAIYNLHIYLGPLVSKRLCFHDYCYEGGMFFYENEVVF
jgi:sister chromatid cohesion protein DCC1